MLDTLSHISALTASHWRSLSQIINLIFETYYTSLILLSQTLCVIVWGDKLSVYGLSGKTGLLATRLPLAFNLFCLLFLFLNSRIIICFLSVLQASGWVNTPGCACAKTVNDDRYQVFLSAGELTLIHSMRSPYSSCVVEEACLHCWVMQYTHKTPGNGSVTEIIAHRELLPQPGLADSLLSSQMHFQIPEVKQTCFCNLRVYRGQHLADFR